MNVIRTIQSLGYAPELKVSLHNIIKFNYPVVEQVRYRRQHLNKPVSNLQREIVKAVTAPRYRDPNEGLPVEEICTKSLEAKKSAMQGEIIHPLDKILGGEVREKIMNAPFVVIFHGNPTTEDSLFDFKVDLHKNNLTFVEHTDIIMTCALRGTPYEALLRLYEGESLTFVGPEPRFTKILSIVKKYSFVSLIGGVYQGRIISVNDFKSLSQNSDIGTYHSQLSALLSAAGQKLSSNITRHQQELCDSLQRYISDQPKKES